MKSHDIAEQVRVGSLSRKANGGEIGTCNFSAETGVKDSVGAILFYCYALCEVTRLGDIGAFDARGVIGEELDRDRVEGAAKGSKIGLCLPHSPGRIRRVLARRNM